MAKKSKKSDPVHIDIIVKTDPNDMVRHAGRCPLSNSLAISEPGEILNPRTKWAGTSKDPLVEISFSRRSTDERYTYQTPGPVKFLDKWDSGIIPRPIRLLLKESHLVETKPRGRGNPLARRQKPKPGPKAKRASSVARPLPTKPDKAPAAA
jgi:hypothetical protein